MQGEKLSPDFCLYKLGNIIGNHMIRASIFTLGLICAQSFAFAGHVSQVSDKTIRSVSSSDLSLPLAPSRPQVSGFALTSEDGSRAAASPLPYRVAAAPTITYETSMIIEKYISDPDDTGLAKFNYAALKANQADRDRLDACIAEMEGTYPSTLTEDEAIAFWANLYNVVTIKVVTDNYPVKSIREIKSGLFSIGPWKKNLVTVNKKKMSLDDIEHETLRKDYPSPLIHYMVNCASVGCPNLKDGLWDAETLDQDREKAARDFINSPRGVRVTEKGLVVSEIYKWFKEDFGTSKENILAHIREYADDELAQVIDDGARIVGYEYDWALNE